MLVCSFRGDGINPQKQPGRLSTVTTLRSGGAPVLWEPRTHPDGWDGAEPEAGGGTSVDGVGGR